MTIIVGESYIHKTVTLKKNKDSCFRKIKFFIVRYLVEILILSMVGSKAIKQEKL